MVLRRTSTSNVSEQTQPSCHNKSSGWRLAGPASDFVVVHVRFTENHTVNFLLVLIELFLLCVTAEALWAKIDEKSAGTSVSPNFRIEEDVPHQSFLHG